MTSFGFKGSNTFDCSKSAAASANCYIYIYIYNEKYLHQEPYGRMLV